MEIAPYSFLRHYRATPHSTTGKTPAELLFGRKLCTTLPTAKQPPENTPPCKADH